MVFHHTALRRVLGIGLSNKQTTTGGMAIPVSGGSLYYVLGVSAR